MIIRKNLNVAWLKTGNQGYLSSQLRINFSMKLLEQEVILPE